MIFVSWRLSALTFMRDKP